MALQPAFLSSTHSESQKVLGIDYTRLRDLCTIHGLRHSKDAQSTKEAHDVFMNSYQKIFLHPKKVLPRIHKVPAIKNVCSPVKDGTSDGDASQSLEAGRTRRNLQKATGTQSRGRQTQDRLINHVIKALRKFPIERSHQEHQAVHNMMRTFPCLAGQLSAEELRHVANIAIIEAWERGHTIFANSGFYVILKGSVRPYNPDSLEEDINPKGPVLSVGEGFGSLESPGEAGVGIVRCVLTTEPSEILKIPHTGYARLKKEKQARTCALKQGLIKSCRFYSQWPALSIQTLSNLLSIRNFPANCVLVKEGKVSPFVGLVREGQCHIVQSIGALMRTAQGDQRGGRMQFVVVGQLGAMDSFGEVSVLRDQPSPCSIVTATEAQIGVIRPGDVKELDPVTISLMLQSTKATYGKMTQEQISREYLRQQRAKEWEHTKSKVLRDALYYNGIAEGSGNWTFCRGWPKTSPNCNLIL
uniref:cyclic nucleotide-binding domain-containing protein 1 n=1 Tax=Centroberyx gerrardi TaxID=166262 RepID=UPI003AAC4D87